jgi:hypothetical protein
MSIDSDHFGHNLILKSPCSAGHAGTTTGINDCHSGGHPCIESTHDFPNQQEVERAEVHRERRAFPRPVKCRSSVDAFAPMHVQPRERLHALADFGKSKIFQMAPFKRFTPVEEDVGQRGD